MISFIRFGVVCAVGVTAVMITPTCWGQLTTVFEKTGESYGITMWGCIGGQMTTNATIAGYGLNVKYGHVGFCPYGDTSIPETCDACKDFDSNGKVRVKMVKHTRYTFNVSFGAGYLSYFGFTSSQPNLDADFDMGGLYAGLWCSMPLRAFGDEGNVKAVLGYTTAVLSNTGVLAKYRGTNPTTAMVNPPITLTIPTTVTHEVNLGLSYKLDKDLVVFLEGNYLLFKVKNVQYAPLNGGNKEDLQNLLSPKMDLSFRTVKVGLSLDLK